MARANYFLLLLTSFSILCFTMTTAAGTTTAMDVDFIKSQCKFSRYETLCVRTFSIYAAAIRHSHYKLMLTAFPLALKQANSTKTYISKLKQRGDCLSLMSDSVARLEDSIEELKKMNVSKGRDFAWNKSNVLTWTSAAYTNADTCLDEVAATSDGGGDQKLKDSIAYFQKLNSISLTFVNHWE